MSVRFVVFTCTFFLIASSRAAGEATFFFGPSSDTLIIDGDTIYIEPNQVMIPSDSLPEQDPGIKKIKQHFLSATLYTGLNVSTYSFQPTSGNLILLDDFIGNPSSSKTNWLGGFDCAARFLSITGPLGTIELAGVAAVNLNRIKARYTTLQNPEVLQVDSILAFNGSGGEFDVQYLTITEPPNIGEVDSISAELSQALLDYSAPEVSAKLRITLNRGPRAVRYFMESGVIHRNVRLKSQVNDIYLVNSSGSWQSIKPADLTGTRMLVPHIALGAEIVIPEFLNSQEGFFTVGAAVNASMPMSTISRVDQLTLQIGNIGVGLYGRYFF